MNKRFVSTIQALLAFTLWSTMGVFFNSVKLPVQVYVVFGSLLGLGILFFYISWVKKQNIKLNFSWSLLILFLVAGVKGIIWFKALQLYPIAGAMLIHNLAPVIALLLTPLFIREKTSLNHYLAVVTGFFGLYILLQFPSTTSLNLGAVLSFVAAICSGIQDIAQRKLSNSVTGTEQALVFILGQALGSIFFFTPTLSTSINWSDISAIVYFAIVGTVLPIVLLSKSFVNLKALEVAILGYSEPLFGAFLAALFLNQPILPTTVMAGFLIFISSVTSVRNEEK